jgi:hypothetical protein
MNLFYNREKNTWFSNESFCWGKNEVLLPSSRLSRYDDIGFSLQQKKNKLGPLIGILTETSKKNHLFAGNTSKFKRIAQAAMLRNGLAFVFTPEGIQTENIKGFLFLTDENKWIAATFPFPDIVYNRVPSRNFEQTTKFQRTLIFLQTNSIPYFNRSFFSKSDVYETLSSSPFLQKYLPHTTVFNDIEDAKEMLNIHKRIFLKPDLGYKGNGLTMIEYRRDDSYIVQTVSSPPVKKSMIELDHFLHSYMATQKWIIQEAIHLKTINQSVFDLRILVHENNSKWTISGIGGRLAKKGGIATHIPNGGTL